MSFKKNLSIFFLIALLSLVVCVIFLYYSPFKDYSKVAATVNGEPISNEAIEIALKQYKSQNLTREAVIQSGINELLVVQEAIKRDIVVNDSEVEERVKSLKDHYPDLYIKAIKMYGIEKYKHGLRYRMLYNKMKDAIKNEYIENNIVETDEIQKWLKENSIENINFDEFYILKDQVTERIVKEKAEIYFNEWVKAIRNCSDINITKLGI